MTHLPRKHTAARPGARSPWVAVLVLIFVAGFALPCFAQTPTPDEDAIELTPLGTAPSPVTPSPALGTGPTQVSVLDVLTRLALLVLAVYGVAWGVNALRKSGVRIGRTALAAQNVRLRECERLALNSGVSLHVIEVDKRQVLLAASSTGDTNLLLDLSEPPAVQAPVEEPISDDAEAMSMSPERLDFTLRDDADWQERRDALIRSLARGG